MRADNAPGKLLWRGRSVLFIDGTGVTMPDTLDNQCLFPQPSSQQKGVGFPEARVVALACAATGAIIDTMVGPAKGKATGELSQMRELARSLRPDDVFVGDAIYETFWSFMMLQETGCDGRVRNQWQSSSPEQASHAADADASGSTAMDGSGDVPILPKADHGPSGRQTPPRIPAQSVPHNAQRQQAGQRAPDRETLSVALEHRDRLPFAQVRPGCRDTQLPDCGNGQEGALSTSARLQSDAAADDGSGSAVRLRAAFDQLPAHRATVECLGVERLRVG